MDHLIPSLVCVEIACSCQWCVSRSSRLQTYSWVFLISHYLPPFGIDWIYLGLSVLSQKGAMLLAAFSPTYLFLYPWGTREISASIFFNFPLNFLWRLSFLEASTIHFLFISFSFFWHCIMCLCNEEERRGEESIPFCWHKNSFVLTLLLGFLLGYPKYSHASLLCYKRERCCEECYLK